jgi:hypothetical protein
MIRHSVYLCNYPWSLKSTAYDITLEQNHFSTSDRTGWPSLSTNTLAELNLYPALSDVLCPSYS